jgi:signal transduction histidine kinase
VRGERRRVARELRDTVGAALLALHASIADLAAVPALDHDLRSRLVDLERQAVEVVAALRRALLSSDAAPERVSLSAAVRAHCEAFQRRTAIVTRLTTLTDVPPMPAARVAALADAVRESLLNVEKHAHARSVVATILASIDLVGVTISDDGIGLPDAAAIEQGLGLAAVGEGLARVGGAITISANGDGGVTVHARVPL